MENGTSVPVVMPACDEQLDRAILDIINQRVTDQVAVAVWEAVSCFATEIAAHKHPELTVAAFCFAAGLYVTEGKSETELAEELGVTRAALSKRIVRITTALGLPPSRGMKTIKARKVYSDAQKAKGKS